MDMSINEVYLGFNHGIIVHLKWKVKLLVCTEFQFGYSETSHFNTVVIKYLQGYYENFTVL